MPARILIIEDNQTNLTLMTYLLISAVYLAITLTLSALARRLEAPAHLRGR